MPTLTKQKPLKFDTDDLDSLIQEINKRVESGDVTISGLVRQGVISQGLWGKIVRGECTPKIATLATMAEAVGMKLSLLLDDADE